MGSIPGWLEGGYAIRVELNTANGLNPSSLVSLNGIQIGQVTKVELQDPPVKVFVDVMIRGEYRIPQTAYVGVESPLLGGSPTLVFMVKANEDGEPMVFLPQDGTAMIEGRSLGLASQLAGELKSAMVEPMKRLDRVADMFEKLTDEWVLVGQNVNRLVGPVGVEDVDSGDAVGNLSTLLARTDTRMAEMEKVLEGLNKWVNDKQLHEDIRQTVSNTRDASEQLSATVEQVRVNVDRLTLSYVAVAEDLSVAIKELQSVAAKANDGDGTMAKLLNDPKLYNNINDAAERLNKVLDETKLLIEKWKAEGVPVQF